MTPNQLRALRARLGLTQQQIAQQLGCSLATYTRWEQHKEADTPLRMLNPYARGLAKLAKTKEQRQENPMTDRGTTELYSGTVQTHRATARHLRAMAGTETNAHVSHQLFTAAATIDDELRGLENDQWTTIHVSFDVVDLYDAALTKTKEPAAS